MRRILLGGALLLVPSAAHAAECDQLNPPAAQLPVIYIESGDTQEPMLKQLGAQLMKTAGNKLRIVYRNRPTCDLATNFYTTAGGRVLGPTSNPVRPISYIPSAAEDAAWDPKTSVSPQCTNANTSFPIDLAIGAAFLSSCTGLPAKPADTTVLDG